MEFLFRPFQTLTIGALHAQPRVKRLRRDRVAQARKYGIGLTSESSSFLLTPLLHSPKPRSSLGLSVMVILFISRRPL
jgi:hypothetical protein